MEFAPAFHLYIIMISVIKKQTMILIMLSFFSVVAQTQNQTQPSSQVIIGEWKVANQGRDSEVEGVVFFPDGLLNITTKLRKWVQRYRMTKTPMGYIIFVTSIHPGHPVASFFIPSINENTMDLVLRKDGKLQKLSLIKTGRIRSGFLPLKARAVHR